jgi:hypothetical protein
VVLADVINASALNTPCPPGTPNAQQVVVDGDLVTTPSWHATEARRYRLAIRSLPAQSGGQLAGPALASNRAAQQMNRLRRLSTLGNDFIAGQQTAGGLLLHRGRVAADARLEAAVTGKLIVKPTQQWNS